MSPAAEPSLALLYEAIDTTSVERLRETLRELCASAAEARQIVSKNLLVTKPQPQSLVVDEDKENEGGSSTSQKRKREEEVVVQRYEMCIHCETEYDVSLNTATSCTYHDGEMEPDFDGDFWADHDERIHGEIDSAELREEYPEGYRWDCCQALGDAKGCQTEAHHPKKAKKARTSLVGTGRVGNIMSISAIA